MLPSSLNIWFNRAYATSYWLIKMLKENPDDTPVKVFATHVDLQSPVLQAADVIELEPTLIGEEYINWALEFCKKYNINVFIPREQALLISKNVSKFEEIGVKVLVNPSATIELFENKELAYLSLAESGLPVPPWSVARGSEDFIFQYEAMRKFLDKDTRIIVKPTVGVGASGFRIINDNSYTMEELLVRPKDDISLNKIIEALQNEEKSGRTPPAFMVMPFLADPEVSVDTLSTGDGKLILNIPRTKDTNRMKAFSNRFPQATEVVSKIVEMYGLTYLTNTQLRWWNDSLVILETNTRASGGLYSSTITGVNIMWMAIKTLFNEPVDVSKVQLDKTYTSTSISIEITQKSLV